MEEFAVTDPAEVAANGCCSRSTIARLPLSSNSEKPKANFDDFCQLLKAYMRGEARLVVASKEARRHAESESDADQTNGAIEMLQIRR